MKVVNLLSVYHRESVFSFIRINDDRITDEELEVLLLDDAETILDKEVKMFTISGGDLVITTKREKGG
jgi:hypothetical protein